MIKIILGMFVSFFSIFQNTTYANTTIINEKIEQQMTPVKEVALTFDDGPYGTSTEEVLNILRKEKINATFFLIGKNVDQYPEIAKEIVNEGNVVGNHTYNHFKNFAKMSSKDFSADLNKAEISIASSTGVIPKLFRAPYGYISNTMKKELTKDGYTLVRWNVDGNDWNLKKTSSQIENSTVVNTKPYSILLMHDGHETSNYSRVNSIDSLPNIIRNLKNEGYSFVTVDKLLETKAY